MVETPFNLSARWGYLKQHIGVNISDAIENKNPIYSGAKNIAYLLASDLKIQFATDQYDHR